MLSRQCRQCGSIHGRFFQQKCHERLLSLRGVAVLRCSYPWEASFNKGKKMFRPCESFRFNPYTLRHPSPISLHFIHCSPLCPPGGVGFDINCGVRLVRTNLSYEDVLPVKEQLTQSLFDHIPVGVGSKGVVPITAADLNDALVRERAETQDIGRLFISLLSGAS